MKSKNCLTLCYKQAIKFLIRFYIGVEGNLNISNNDKKAYYANSIIGIAGGYSAYKYIPQYIRKPFGKYYSNKFETISSFENNQYWDSAIQAFRNSKVFNPKLEIIDINETNWERIADNIIQKRKNAFQSNRKQNPLKKFLAKILSPSDEVYRNKIKTMAMGRNACFIPFTSQILVNKEKMGITTFHEIGHAINRYGKGIRKILAKSRAISFFALPAVLGIGLVTPKREEGNEYKNPIGKTATFIKEHCGLLAGLSLLPIIIEEGVASINGAQLAKKVLDKNMYKKLNKYNAMAFSSYVLGAITVGLGSAIAVYIKDKVSGTAPVRNKN